MADTTVLSAAQISAAAAAGAQRTVVPAFARNVALRDTRFTFYMGDSGSPGLHVQIVNNEFQEDSRIADISGPGGANALTAADRTALVGLLEKLHVGRVMP